MFQVVCVILGLDIDAFGEQKCLNWWVQSVIAAVSLVMCRKHTHLHVNNKTHPHVPPFRNHAHHHVNNYTHSHIPPSYVPTSPQVV